MPGYVSSVETVTVPFEVLFRMGVFADSVMCNDRTRLHHPVTLICVSIRHAVGTPRCQETSGHCLQFSSRGGWYTTPLGQKGYGRIFFCDDLRIRL